MKLIFSPSHYPFFNLALEEYLSNFTERNSEYLLFYRNTPSVVIGKNQNAWEEMNFDYLKKQKVLLSRRISGGGTVYHDLQNLNFSYIKPLDTKLVANYDSMLQPIVGFLKTLDLKAQIGKRSDIWLEKQVENNKTELRKITGTAQYTNKYRFITHGTLLFDTDLEKLEKAITIPKNIEVSSKSLKSVRSKVTNIKEILEQKSKTHISSIEQFEEKLAHFMLLYFNEPAHVYKLNPSEVEQIETLAKEKYKSFEWIWGRSPASEITRKIRFKNQEHTLHLKLQREAIIESIEVQKGLIDQRKQLNEELQSLVGKTYWREELEKTLLPLGFDKEDLDWWF